MTIRRNKEDGYTIKDLSRKELALLVQGMQKAASQTFIEAQQPGIGSAAGKELFMKSSSFLYVKLNLELERLKAEKTEEE